MTNKKYNVDERFIKYALDVVSGKIVSGKLMKLQCQKHLDNFKNKDYYFDTKSCDRVEHFINKLKHVRGSFAGKPFELLDWQKHIIYYIYGWKKKDTGYRLVKEVFIEVARKSGKSSLLSALGLYSMLEEPGASVQICSPSRKQSNLIFTASQEYVSSINKGGIFKVLRNTIECPFNHSEMTTMSSDTHFGDGFNCSTAMIDESHEIKNPDIYNVMISSQGMRTQPLLIQITTSGFDLQSFCKSYRDNCVDVLNGVKQSEFLAPFIFELDEGDDWKDEKVWKKASPSLGVTVGMEYMRNQVQNAVNNPSLEVGVKTKNLNIWCSSKSQFLPDEYLLKSMEEPFDFWEISKDKPVWVGVDLSATQDFTAVSYLYVDEQTGIYYFHNDTYLPEKSMDQSFAETNGYKEFVRLKELTLTSGNTTDYDKIIDDLVKNDKRGYRNIQKIAYDRWNATYWAQKLDDQLNCDDILEPFSQKVGNFNGPTKILEMLFLSNKIRLEKSSLMLFQLRGIDISADNNGNIKPKKVVRGQKIDNVITMIQAIGTYNYHCNEYDSPVGFDLI